MAIRAESVTEAAVSDGADEASKLVWGRRPDLAEVAEQTVGARRLIARFGLSIPLFFVVATIAAASTLGQPLRGGFDLAAFALWTGGTLLLLSPFAAALIVMLNSRRGGLVWTTTLVYTIIAGVLGLSVAAAVFGADLSTAAFSLVSALIVEVVLLAPVCAAVAFLVRIVRD